MIGTAACAHDHMRGVARLKQAGDFDDQLAISVQHRCNNARGFGGFAGHGR